MEFIRSAPQHVENNKLTHFGRLMYSTSLSKCFVVLAFATASCSAVAIDERLSRVGSGDMKWHFWHLYEASLFTETGDLTDSRPMALSLTYKRSISSENLVKATQKEWSRMGVSHPNQERWIERLFQLWPDVEEGDEISVLVDESGSTTFYFNDEPIGVFDDPDFSDVFLAIWLSEKARNQDLRRRLLGLS